MQLMKMVFATGILVGVVFGYVLNLPVAVRFMSYFNNAIGTMANWKIDAYLGFVFQLLIGFGLAMPPSQRRFAIGNGYSPLFVV